METRVNLRRLVRRTLQKAPERELGLQGAVVGYYRRNQMRRKSWRVPEVDFTTAVEHTGLPSSPKMGTRFSRPRVGTLQECV